MPKKQTEWSRNFNESAYDRLAITVPKGRKADIEAFTKTKGVSINGFVNELLRNALGMSVDDWSIRDEQKEQG